MTNNSLTRIFLQFQMTFHLFIAAFVGAAATLVSLVSCFKIILENKWSRDSVSGIRLRLEEILLPTLKDWREALRRDSKVWGSIFLPRVVQALTVWNHLKQDLLYPGILYSINIFCSH